MALKLCTQQSVCWKSKEGKQLQFESNSEKKGAQYAIKCARLALSRSFGS